jgi:hypothetical protein
MLLWLSMGKTMVNTHTVGGFGWWLDPVESWIFSPAPNRQNYNEVEFYTLVC